MELVNQMRCHGDILSKVMVVSKVLVSLGPKYNHVDAAMEESKNLTKFTMDELSGFFKAHEARLLSQDDKGDEKEHQVKCETFGTKDGEKALFRGRGIGFPLA